VPWDTSFRNLAKDQILKVGPMVAEEADILGTGAEFELLRRRILCYLLSKGLARPAAEDLTQDSLVTLLGLVRKDPDRYVVDRLVPTAITTARNKLLNHWKKKSTRGESQSLPDDDPPAGQLFDPEREAGFSELRAAIRRLGEECRRIIYLKYFLRYSSREVAVRLPRQGQKKPPTENAVNVRTSRCLQELRENFMAGRARSR
jgi:RNA polymerase sigma factor (sigma-70 family)